MAAVPSKHSTQDLEVSSQYIGVLITQTLE
jgi:hypothetical protein